MSESIDDAASILSVQYTIILSIATLSGMYFVYGLYVLLFGAAVYMMRSRQQCNEWLNWSLYLSLTVILFVFSTAYVVVITIFAVRKSIICFTAVKTRDYEPMMDYWRPLHDNYKTVSIALTMLIIVLLKYLTSLINAQEANLRHFSITAEVMLIHRCYLIWSSRKRVGLLLVVASILTNITGVISVVLILASIGSESSNLVFYTAGETINVVYSITNVIVNTMITFLTAGRIWWIHRQVHAHGVHASDKLMHSVFRIILESGLIYPMMNIIVLITFNTTTVDELPFDFVPLTTLSAGIAPTLIMVRAKLGKSVESLQDKVSDIRFTSQPRLQEGTITISRAQLHSTMATIGVDSDGQQRLADGKETLMV
ncbi:hypothetical protein Moror_1904 [Moniliophthora roreri MCA 2997]|uniref:Uncharacterized protein n=1 Tax=Moniliophthora roreri (strain MCA 2997) TaxID=1381753 RepID=V2X1I8_MONRO|nr:hypothetical protein Moror_1904 [Moniliophthora roreri MCA 2997]